MLGELGDDPRGLDLVMLGPWVQPEDRLRPSSHGFPLFPTGKSWMVALLCLRRAKNGGLSTLVSSLAVHNVMAERRPDLLERLYQPFPGARRLSPEDYEALDMLAELAADPALRLWLSPPNARTPLPPIFAEAYGTLTIGDRGGIICKDTIPHAPLTPA